MTLDPSTFVETSLSQRSTSGKEKSFSVFRTQRKEDVRDYSSCKYTCFTGSCSLSYVSEFRFHTPTLVTATILPVRTLPPSRFDQDRVERKEGRPCVWADRLNKNLRCKNNQHKTQLHKVLQSCPVGKERVTYSLDRDFEKPTRVVVGSLSFSIKSTSFFRRHTPRLGCQDGNTENYLQTKLLLLSLHLPPQSLTELSVSTTSFHD